MKAAWGRVLKWLAMAVLALAALVAVASVIGSVKLRQEYDALRKAGRPMRAEQIIPAPVAEEDNGAPLLTAAQSLLAAESIGTNSANDALSTVVQRVKKGSLDEGQLRELDQYIRSPSAGRIWGLLQTAAQRKACRFLLAWDQGPNMLLPHISSMRNLSRALAAKAVVDARCGRTEEAWETLDVGMRIADILRDEPILVSQLVRLAQFGLTTDAIRTAAASAPPTERQAQALARQLAAFDLAVVAVKALDGERLLFGGWMRKLSVSEFARLVAMSGSHGSHKPGYGWVLFRVIWSPVFDLDQAAYLRLMREYSDLNARSPREWLLVEQQDPINRVPRYCIMTRLLAPALSATWRNLALAQSDVAVTRAGLLLQIHKCRHGAYPETLDGLDAALKPELPLDPLTGQALLYRREGDGFVLYSVGENLKDDGGTEEKAKDSSKPLDTVWRAPR